MKYIDIKIDKAGNIQIETEGFSGTACQEATKELLNQLGGIEREQLKNEYYKENENEEIHLT